MDNASSKAAATFIDQTHAVVTLLAVKEELKTITEGDLPRLACLLDLLQEQKVIADDPTLSAAFFAICELFCQTWDRIDLVTKRLSSGPSCERG